MPSPVGHTIAGICGFIVFQKKLTPRLWTLFFLFSIFIANLPDLDMLPGLLIGDIRSFHHQGMHSITASVLVGLLISLLARQWKLNWVGWGLWGGGIYLSHVLLDLLVNDPSPPFGSQLFWPFSKSYFISPITPFARFDYFNPGLGMVRTIFTLHNFGAVLREVILMTPLVGLTWYIKKYVYGEYLER